MGSNGLSLFENGPLVKQLKLDLLLDGKVGDVEIKHEMVDGCVFEAWSLGVPSQVVASLYSKHYFAPFWTQAMSF